MCPLKALVGKVVQVSMPGRNLHLTGLLHQHSGSDLHTVTVGSAEISFSCRQVNCVDDEKGRIVLDEAQA